MKNFNNFFTKILQQKSLTFALHFLIPLIITFFFIFIIIILISIHRKKKNFLINVQQKILQNYEDLKKQYQTLNEQYIKLKGAFITDKSIDNQLQREEIDFIFKLQQHLIDAFYIDIACRIIVEQIHKFLNVQKTIILLIDKNTNQLKIVAANGIDSQEIKNFILKSNESISGFVLTQNKPLLVENLSDENYLKSINKEDYLGGNFVSIPISLQNQIFGVLHICSKNTGQFFTKSEFLFLENLGKLIAIVFKNIFLYQELNENYLKTIAALASAIDARDPYTKYHSENVTRYSVAIAQEMKLPYKEIEIIKQAALLHDIGKIGIRDEVLLKMTKLNEQEYEQMKMHPLKAQQILESLSFLKNVSVLIRHHHERFDGKGYPDAISDKQIELGARIIAVADTFDAMTTDRPYRKALTLEEAISELKKAKNNQLDPEIVDYFIKVLETNPEILRKTND
ncbi:MAG: HD-GYP domain-containing protein [Candidatus Omnitrophica bacterium]|nr:HD-GYP domain-containing protein [Candidatus Omnitrophota bacterium]